MAQSRATSTDPELPATSFSFENFATSSGTSHEVTSGPTRCVPTTSSLSTHSLSWRPRPVQKGSLEAGGLVHRALQRWRDRTPRRNPPHTLFETNPRILLEGLDVSADRTSTTTHLGAFLKSSSHPKFPLPTAPRACGPALKRGAGAPVKIPRHVTQSAETSQQRWCGASCGESFSTP